jgi:hypothetical protein
MKPTIYLSSFRQYHTGDIARRIGQPFSIAVYQPQWWKEVPEAPLFNILNEKGDWIRPREFIPPNHDGTKPSQKVLQAYFEALFALYDTRRDQIRFWLRSQDVPRIGLLCWCPYDRAAKRQLEDFGSFVCHSAAVGEYLKRLGYRVLRDVDRKRMVWPKHGTRS